MWFPLGIYSILHLLTLFLPAMGGISPCMSVTWQQPVRIVLTDKWGNLRTMWSISTYIQILPLSSKSHNQCKNLLYTWMPNMQQKYHWKWDTLKKCSLGCEFICSVPMISISCASCMGKGWKRELLNRVENNSNVLMYSTAVYPNYIYIRTVSSSLLVRFGTFHSFLASLGRNRVYSGYCSAHKLV
jgi:hypothetical protein